MNHSQEGDFHHSKLCQAPSLFASYKEICYYVAKLYKIILRNYGLFGFFYTCGLNLYCLPIKAITSTWF